MLLTNIAAIFLLFKKMELFSAYMLQKQKKAESLGMNRKKKRLNVVNDRSNTVNPLVSSMTLPELWKSP